LFLIGAVTSKVVKQNDGNLNEGQTDEDNPEEATLLQRKGGYKNTTGHG
jgi:hypothetical protein